MTKITCPVNVCAGCSSWVPEFVVLYCPWVGEQSNLKSTVLSFHWRHSYVYNPNSRKKKIPRGATSKGGDKEQRNRRDSASRTHWLPWLIATHTRRCCFCLFRTCQQWRFWIPEDYFIFRLSWKSSLTTFDAWPPPSIPSPCLEARQTTQAHCMLSHPTWMCSHILWAAPGPCLLLVWLWLNFASQGNRHGEGSDEKDKTNKTRKAKWFGIDLERVVFDLLPTPVSKAHPAFSGKSLGKGRELSSFQSLCCRGFFSTSKFRGGTDWKL
jgi:hypothetical protein